MGLTIKRIARANEPGRYSDGDGLYLQVRRGRNGKINKSWVFRWERGGKGGKRGDKTDTRGTKKGKQKQGARGTERMMGLGPLDIVPLDTYRDKDGNTIVGARDRALRARQQLLDGIDPLAAKQAQATAATLEAAKAITFEEAARQYHAGHEHSWKNSKHAKQFLSTLRMYAFPVIGKLPVANVDTGLVLKVIEPLWRDKRETANRTRGRIERVLDWCTVRGYRKGDNPARWKGHLSEALANRSPKAQRHHPALPYTALPAFMTDLRAKEGVAAKALEFTILTAARTSETVGARLDEIDLKAKTWTVPAERIKGGKEHKVPLPDRAIEILKALPQERGNDFVFIGPRKGGLSNMAMSSVLKRMERDDITVHGFRSTFRDWAAECTSYPNHVVEQALAHVIGDKVEAAYRRGDLFDKRVKLMRDWAKYASTKPAKATGNVVPIRAQR